MGADLGKFAVDLVVAFAFGFGLTELVGLIRRFGDGGTDGPGRWPRWSPPPPSPPRPHGGRAERRPPSRHRMPRPRTPR